MRPIYIKRDFEDGYLEVIYRNHGSCEWWNFRPDPRKKKHHCPKFWRRGGGIGKLDSLCEDRQFGCVSAEWRDYYQRRHAIVVEMLMEAARRYDQRYAKFGELGNAEMPIDPAVAENFRILEEWLRLIRENPRNQIQVRRPPRYLL